MTDQQQLPADAVFATTADGYRVRVSDHLSWDDAQSEWRRLDDLRLLEGRFPHVRFFTVRSTDDPAWSDAPLSTLHSRPVVKGSRGFGDSTGTGRGSQYRGIDKAARAAWKLFTGGKYTLHSASGKPWKYEQGRGGWFYWPNGRIAAQGLRDLANVCERRSMIVEGQDGRWYVVEPEPVA